MGFVGAIKAGYANYFNFSGRATRPAYWWFQLWILLLLMGLGIFGVMAIGVHDGSGLKLVAELFAALFGLLFLGTIFPAISLQVRRLHDACHSGWWVLISFLAHVARSIWMVAMRHDPGIAADLVALLLDLVSLGLSLTILIFSFQRSKQG